MATSSRGSGGAHAAGASPRDPMSSSGGATTARGGGTSSRGAGGITGRVPTSRGGGGVTSRADGGTTSRGGVATSPTPMLPPVKTPAPVSVDAESGIISPHALHDKVGSARLDLGTARRLGAGIRATQTAAKLSSLHSPTGGSFPVESGWGDDGDDSPREGAHAAVMTMELDPEEEERNIDDFIATMQRDKATQGRGAGGGRGTSQLDRENLVKTELQRARDAAIAETNARARRSSVNMMESEASAAAAARRADAVGRASRNRARRTSNAGSTTGDAADASRGEADKRPRSRGSSAGRRVSITSAGGAAAADGDDDEDDARVQMTEISEPGSATYAKAVLGVYGVGTAHRGGLDAAPTSMLSRIDPIVIQAEHPVHLLVINLGTAKRQAFKAFAKAFSLKLSLVTTIRDALTMLSASARTAEPRINCVFADIAEGADAIIELLRQMRSSGISVPVIIATPPASELLTDASSAIARAVAECSKLGVAAAIEKPLAYDQLAVRTRVLVERAAKASMVYEDVRTAKTLRDMTRYKSQHRAAYVEEQYQETLKSRPQSRGLAATLQRMQPWRATADGIVSSDALRAESASHSVVRVANNSTRSLRRLDDRCSPCDNSEGLSCSVRPGHGGRGRQGDCRAHVFNADGTYAASPRALAAAAAAQVMQWGSHAAPSEDGAAAVPQRGESRGTSRGGDGVNRRSSFQSFRIPRPSDTDIDKLAAAEAVDAMAVAEAAGPPRSSRTPDETVAISSSMSGILRSRDVLETHGDTSGSVGLLSSLSLPELTLPALKLVSSHDDALDDGAPVDVHAASTLTASASVPALRGTRALAPVRGAFRGSAVAASSSRSHTHGSTGDPSAAAPPAAAVRDSLDYQYVSPSRLNWIRKARVLQPKDIAAAAAAAAAEAEAMAEEALRRKRTEAAQLARSRQAVLQGQADAAFTSRNVERRARRGAAVISASPAPAAPVSPTRASAAMLQLSTGKQRRGSVVAAEILTLGRNMGAGSDSSDDDVHAHGAAASLAAAHFRRVHAQRTTTPSQAPQVWKPSGPPLESTGGSAATRSDIIQRQRHLRTRHVHDLGEHAKTLMRAHVSAVQSHFIARAAALRAQEQREVEAEVRKRETAARRAQVQAEIAASRQRADRGETFTDDHARYVNMSRVHEAWMAFDILKGQPKEPLDTSLGNLTKAHFFVRRGVGKREAGEEDAAIALYTRALRVDPACTVAHLLRGASYFRLSKFEKAIADYGACIAANRRDADALYNRALTHAALGDYHNCMEDINMALEIRPRDVDALQLRGLIRRRLRDYEGAHQDYSSILYINMALEASQAASRTASVAAAAAAAALDANVTAVANAGIPVPVADARRTSRLSATGLGPSASMTSIAKSLSGDSLSRAKSLSALTCTPDETAAQLRDLLTGGTDLYSIIFEQTTSLQRALQVPPKERTEEHVMLIRSVLQTLIFFRQLDDAMQIGFARNVMSRTYYEGDIITNEGQPVRYLHVVANGECTVKVSVGSTSSSDDATGGGTAAPAPASADGGPAGDAGGTEISVDVLQTGDHFGDLSLLFGEQRTLTVVVKSATADLLLLPRAAFFRLGLDNAFIDDLEYRRDVLKRTGAFDLWQEADLLKLCCAAKYRQCRKHAALVKQGDLPREFIVLLKGIAHVFKASDALADLELRLKALREEATNIQSMFSYHHSLRTRSPARRRAEAAQRARAASPPALDATAGTVSSASFVGPAAPAEAADASGSSTSRSESRLALMAKMLGHGHSNVTSLMSAMRTLKDRGMRLDDDAVAAASQGIVNNSNLALRVAPHYHAPQTDILPSTFVEMYAEELQSRVEELEKQRAALLRTLQSSARRPSSRGSVTGSVPEEAGTTRTHTYRVLVESLYPPCILSPLAVTDPWVGLEPGEFVAETYVELLVINKAQIDHRLFDKPKLLELQSRAVRFPRDGFVIDKFHRERAWASYRADVIAEVDKRRWPIAQNGGRLVMLPRGKQVVVDDDAEA